MLAVLAPLTVALALADTTDDRFLLKGQAVDATGAAVPKAQVTAISADQRSMPTTLTDPSGGFLLSLAPGTYKVTVTAPGFLEASRQVTALAEGSGTQKFVLKVAPFGESVTVRATGDYDVGAISSGTKTLTALRDLPQSVTVTTKQLMRDQLMLSVGDVMRYTPGIQVHQGENNRDQVVIRGNSSSADFFLNGVRDDVQYYRDLYNLDRVEALKGSNAMTFGRGGGGGVVNRVTKEAIFEPVRAATVQAGGYGHKRFAGDLGQALSDVFAFRLNAMYEDSDSFRRDVNLERYAVNPTLTILASERTRATLGYEHLHDTRVADRGITSFQGRPADVDVRTYYGNPADSHVRAGVDIGTATIEQKLGNVTLRNRTLFGSYDRFYQNYVPGAVTPDKSLVALTAYNNATQRENLFNQTDVIHSFATGSVKHTFVAGAELGRQKTDNFRNTGFFNDATTSLSVPYSNPTISTSVTYRQSATDANNHLDTNLAAGYVQEQLELSPKLHVLGGLRFDRFDLTYHNNRNGDTLERVDDLISPRAGIVYKPIPFVSVYGSYGVSYLPSSGDQFSSLTTITEQVKPEKFDSYEMGVKWQPRAALFVTAACYRLDRTNTRSNDPNDPTRIVQTGSQRTNGFELGVTGAVTGAWRVAGGYAYQNAYVSSATAAARADAQVAQVPHHTLSLWNHYRVRSRLSVAAGVLFRTDMFAAIDNTVRVPGYTRFDVAAFYAFRNRFGLQANLENAFDKTYWINADSNTNLSPGFGRTLRVAVSAVF